MNGGDPHPCSPPSPTRPARAYWIVVGVLVVGLGTSAAVATFSDRAVERGAARTFDTETTREWGSLQDQLDQSVADIGSAAAMISVEGRFDRNAFVTFGRRLRPADSADNSVGMIFIEPVPVEQLASVEAAQQAAGSPSFRIQDLPPPPPPFVNHDQPPPLPGDPGGPPDRGPGWSPLIALASTSPTSTIEGMDLGASRERRDALERARDTGAPAMTAPVSLVVDKALPSDKRPPSVALFAPVYRTSSPPDTIAARRAALIGWVGTALRINDTLARVVATGPNAVGLALYDGPTGRLLGETGPDVGARLRSGHGRVREVTVMTFGREMTARMTTTASFSVDGEHDPLLLLVAGIALTLGLASIVSGHARARRRLTRQAADSASRAEAATRHAEEARSAAAQVATEAERAIREAEALFRGAFESAAFGMTITDMDLRFLRVNEAMCRLTGRTEAELLTLGVADITHPDDQALRDRQVGRLVDGGTEHYAIEKRYIRPDGTTRWARVNVSMIRDANGAPVVLVGQIEDIEAARKAEEDLRAVQRRFQALVEHSSDIITVFDDTGTILFASPSADRILGYPEGTQLGRSVFELLHPEDVGQAQISLRGSAIEAGAAIAVQLRVRHADGTWRDVETVATNLLDDPDVAGIVMNSRDVTEREQAAAEITFRAFHDLLTGLPNRALLLDRLSHALHRAKRSGDLVAVLYLDLDRFKLVNDSLGHAAGDELLAEVARRLTRAVRPGDTVGRIGGDEFVVVAESVEGVGGARTVAERISGALAAPVLLSSGDEIVVTTSVGIAVSTHHRPDELLQEADTALYRAKEAGRDQYVVYDETFRERARHRMNTERILRNALEGGGMALHYQPIVDLDTGRVRGVEALLRVRDESGELVGPADLIPVAEDTGLIVAMGAGITAEACRQAVAWDRILRDAAPAYVSVNVSARQLTTPGFTAHVAAALKGADASPGSLCLELTEGVLIEGGRTTLRTLDELHTMGVLLAIDDFGTGYSSMAYLKRFPIDIVKIDRAFISGLGTDPEDPAIVRAIITLGDALGLTIIAEGIEDATQLSILQQLGCAQGQGFLFARPLPPEALEAHLTAHVFV